MTLLEEIRAGLASPFADRIAVGASVLTRAEARAVERALSSASTRSRTGEAGTTSVAVGRKGLVRFTFLGVEVVR